MHRLVLVPGEGHGENVLRRAQSLGQQRREGLLGNGDFIGGNRQAAFGDVKHALGGAAVGLGIVQHALRDAIGAHVGRGETVGAGRKGHEARQARPIQHEGCGQPGGVDDSGSRR